MKRHLLLVVVAALAAQDAVAQDLTPRAYWPAPRGFKVAVVGYSYSWGDVVTDPSLPVVGVDSQLHKSILAYGQTLGWFGRTTNFLVEFPYAWGTSKGTHLGDPVQRDVAGFGDVGVTLSVNILGAPSMTLPEFRAFRQNPSAILGASLKLVAPTGHYEVDRLINVGTNRWAVRVELGYARVIRRVWIAEFQAGTWFFSDNDEFVGSTRQQEPVLALQAHFIREFASGLWAAFDINYYTGGQTTVGGVLRADLQRNSRLGGTLVYPFAGRHAAKLGYSFGAVTESGGDFSILLVSYTLVLP